jgi:hypothetical protein
MKMNDTKTQGIDDDKDILDSVARIRRRFKAQAKDPNEVKLSFVDEINNLVRSVLKDSDVSVYDALSQESLDNWKKNRFRRWVRSVRPQKVFMVVLLMTITSFLIVESLPFYSMDGVVSTKTWVQAILMELCFIFVSTYRANSIFQNAILYIARAGTFALMLFVVSTKVLYAGAGIIDETNIIKQKIEIVESQIREKEDQIKFYKEKNWGNTVRSMIKEKDALSKELIGLKNKQIEGKSESVSDLTLYKTWASAAFRVMLMLISVLISRKLFSF